MSGWCTVGADQKLGLLAETAEEAEAEVISLGLPWYGHCNVCYKWIANEPHQICPTPHSAAERYAARLRANDLRRYLYERALDGLEEAC
jgi:hypothetical protein